ncbi:hypothetical protein M153_453000922 [Pseudoloma neurophilia]|uniref:Uncharacterized protein n=1 Tax=Pseudoloma neurophilia TaxID=146866 RepID=A0A0R0LXE0_9MICR|nr:hypothetical protein M153_453000922 [Pseudoloma neurophilia]
MKNTLWITFVLSIILIVTFIYFVLFEEKLNIIRKRDISLSIQKIVDLTRELIEKCKNIPQIDENMEIKILLDQLNVISSITDERGNIKNEKLHIITVSVEKIQKKITEMPLQEDKQIKNAAQTAERLLFEIYSIVSISS